MILDFHEVKFQGVKGNHEVEDLASHVYLVRRPTRRDSSSRLSTVKLCEDIHLEDRLLLSAPALPGYFKGAEVLPTQVNLSWSDSKNETGYRVCRWVNSSWKQVGSAGANPTSYSVAGLRSNAICHFTVHVYNSAGSASTSYGAVNTTRESWRFVRSVRRVLAGRSQATFEARGSAFRSCSRALPELSLSCADNRGSGRFQEARTRDARLPECSKRPLSFP